jgi:large subunit ribosomal protein L4e
MKVKIIGLDGKEGNEVNLPRQFSEAFRPDLIKKAVLVIQSHNIQKTGVNPKAGMRSSSYLSKRRRRYRGTYGPGRSRSPRKILSARGLHIYYVGAFAPNTVGGRVSHPSKATKDWTLDINVKERRKAIRSAIAATMDQKIVKKRGHRCPSIVLDNKIEDLAKTKDVERVLKAAGFNQELERVAVKKIRAGKGKNRGRPYRKKKGPLVVVSKVCPLVKATQNMQGFDICTVKDLNVELLAPGTDAGRVTIWSDKALEIMEKDNLFY